MENLILLVATTLMATIRPRRLRQTPIAATGCSLRMPNHKGFHVSETASGDHMYFSETAMNGAVYGIVMIKFRGGKPASEWKSLLSEFTENLHPSFGIAHATGAEWNYWHPQSPTAIGFSEYAQDRNGADWKIQSWINNEVMTVLYVKNINEAPMKLQEDFLESFRFSA